MEFGFFCANKSAERCLLVWDNNINGPDLPIHIYEDSGSMIVSDLGIMFDNIEHEFLISKCASGLKRLSQHMESSGKYGKPRLYFAERYSLYYIEFTPGTNLVTLGIYYINTDRIRDELTEQIAPQNLEYICRQMDLSYSELGKYYRQEIGKIQEQVLESEDGWEVEQVDNIKKLKNKFQLLN